jgi:hypothetical protein
MSGSEAMRWGLIGVAALAVAALAGCGKPAPNAAANGADGAAQGAAANTAAAAAAAPEATAVAGGPAGPIALGDLPAPAAGEWTRVSSQDGAAPQTDNKCFDGKPIDPNEGMPKPCAKLDAERTAGGGFTVKGDCANNGIDAKLTLAGEGDFKKSFSIDASMTMTGGPGGDLTTKNHSAYTYVGPTCAK